MVVQELALQGSSFRGHDESDTSLNQGNVKSWIGFAAKLNEGIKNVVLDKAPGNAKYTSPNIQKEILAIIMRGQGYDGASNMSGKFNGLRALFLRDCPYAYFVHCFAHKLQLTLVASAKACDPVWDFFSLLDCIINIVKSSPKRIVELQAIHKRDIDGMLKSGEIQSGQGANQMRSLTRAGQTRWHSHYHSVLSIIDMFHATCEVLRDISENCKEGPARAQARGAYQKIETFEFVFHLHLMKAMMEITNFLCQAFQQESVDIVAALGYVSSVKAQLQQLRDEGWGTLLEEVRSFCSKHDIEVLELNDTIGRGANRTTVEQRYHFDIFNQCIDFQLGALNSRFNESSVRLLQLSVALDPKYSFRSFSEGDIYKLAEEFYPQDFEEYEMHCLRSELRFYNTHVVHNQEYGVSSLAMLLEKLVETRMDLHYKMICRLMRLVLTLPVSTATTERSFSAMKFLKTDLRNKMSDEFLEDCLTIFFEREYAIDLDEDSIVDEFAKVKDRRVQLMF
ncbi:Zinc finger MYM-type protein 1 [Linum perenne]